MWAPRWAIFSTATVGPVDLPRPQSGPPRAAMVQVGNLIGRTQMPHDQAVSGSCPQAWCRRSAGQPERPP